MSTPVCSPRVLYLTPGYPVEVPDLAFAGPISPHPDIDPAAEITSTADTEHGFVLWVPGGPR